MSIFKEKCDLCNSEFLYDNTFNKKGEPMYFKYGWQLFTGKQMLFGSPHTYKICSACHNELQTLMEKIKAEHEEKDPFEEAFKDD